jgi:hypothetical protein
MNTDPFWADEISILFREDRLLEFFLNKEFIFEEKLNAIARLGVYISVVLSLYNSNPKFILLSLITFGVTYFIREFFIRDNYSPDIPEKFKENFTEEQKFAVPTVDNPFMNPSIINPVMDPPSDYFSGTEEAAKVREDVKAKFEHNLFRDVDDIFETNNNRLSFHTVPRDDGLLKDFLFGGMSSGKIDQYHNATNQYTPLQFSNRVATL